MMVGSSAGSAPVIRDEGSKMTQNKHFKKRVRARMAETGESYTQARRALHDGRDKPVKLRLMGYWKHYWEQKWPDPLDLVDASWDLEERQKVLRYLRAGAVLRTTEGTSRNGNGWCRLGCSPDPSVLGVRKDFFTGSGTSDDALSWQERRLARYKASKKSTEANLSSRQEALHMGRAELTDGVYVWPEGLAHYLEKHNVRLPKEFVQHVLSSPAVRVPENYTIDESWWLQGHSVLSKKEMTERTQWSEESPFLLQIESPFLPGWYYHDAEYPEEGSSGPYDTRELAETAAKMSEYDLEDVTFWEQKDMSRVFNRHMLKQIEDQVGEVAAVFEGTENSTNVRQNMAEKLSILLSELMVRMKKEGVRTPSDDGIEIVWPEMTEADREKRLLRYEIKITEPHRYSQFIDALVSEGLLPMQTLVGLGLVEDQ
jgi:hypothetical protein